jgi:hypothetical protein
MQERIGHAAGSIYRYLASNGENTTATLRKELELEDANLVTLGVGWLAREGKVTLRAKGKTLFVSLTNGS